MVKHNFFETYINRLISSSNNASARSRTTYFILSLTCIFVLIGVFNMESSWERHINFKERPNLGFVENLYPNDVFVQKVINKEMPFDSLKGSSKILYEKYIENMSQNFTNELFKRFELQIPVLGIRIFASDLSIIATIGITIVFTWLYFSIRREYHIVRKIKEEFDKTHDFTLKENLYYGTVFENIFTTATKDNLEFKTIKILSAFSFVFKKFVKYISPRNIMFLLRFLPTLTILATIFSDLWNLKSVIFSNYTWEIVFRDFIALVGAFYTFIIALQILSYDKGIEFSLNTMRGETTLS